MSLKHQKLYAYVDESGQDSKGEIFLVSVVIVGSRRDELRKLLQQIEKKSRKNKKWTKERRPRRKMYIEQLIGSKELLGCIYYAHYTKARVFIDLTILATAWAILDQAKDPYKVTVYVDGLRREERSYFTSGLRRLHVKTQQARGLKDESDEFIRLADAIAGFVRDGIEGDDIMAPLYKKAIKKGLIKKT